MSKFNYTQKESYTQEDMDAILKQHNGFVSAQFAGSVSKEDYEAATKELKGFKTEKFNARLTKLASTLTDSDKTSGLIALTKDINEDSSDEDITKAFAETQKQHIYLAKAPVSDDEADKDLSHSDKKQNNKAELSAKEKKYGGF